MHVVIFTTSLDRLRRRSRRLGLYLVVCMPDPGRRDNIFTEILRRERRAVASLDALKACHAPGNWPLFLLAPGIPHVAPAKHPA